MFQFKVEVFDGVDSAVFVLYDPEAEQFTGFSCEELINNIAVTYSEFLILHLWILHFFHHVYTAAKAFNPSF